MRRNRAGRRTVCSSSVRRHGAVVLAAFMLVVLLGGANQVAVRFSNRELPPFFGAGLRFLAAALLLHVLAWWQRIDRPQGKALAGAALFGIVNFGMAYAFAYWALVDAPAALASTTLSLVPLLTLFLAVMLGLERFRWRGLAGGLIATVGIGLVFAEQLRAVSLGTVAALLASAGSVALSTVIAKRLPGSHPVATNAVAMLPGAALLFALSLLAGERIEVPHLLVTWLALGYLVLCSVKLFAGFLFLVKRWTASAASYATVLFPVVTIAIGAVFAAELVTWPFVAGTGLVMLGVYLGAIADPTRSPQRETAGSS